MKKKFTILITAAFMLLTMMASTGTMWGQTRDTQTVSYGWETTDDATPWTISEAIVATSGQGNTGSYAGKINTNSTTVQFNEKVYVTSFSYAFKRTSTNNNYSVYIETSTDGSTWSIKDTQAMNTFTNGSYRTVTKEFDGTTELYVRFRCNNTTAVRYVDDVTITYTTSGSTLSPSDLALTNASTSLVFDLYNNSDPYVINYTTSSTGEVTVSESDCITAEVDQTNKTITVTPIAVTNGAKVITVNQAADDNYASGSKTFTINITDSTPFAGGDVTFNATEDMGTSPLVKNGVTFACSNGALNNGSEYRLYKNSVTTFSVESGYSITQIDFTCTSSNPASGFASQEGWTTDGDNGTWTGNSESVSFTASGAQVRATQIVVTVAAPTSDPYITAADVDIDYDATGGNIAFTVNNEVTGGVISASTSDSWITLGSETTSPITFTCDANTEGTARTATVTLTYTYNTTETVSKEVTITQAAAPVVYSTIPALFEAATTTEVDVNVTFNNWVISAVKNSNAYLTDNAGNGLIIYASGHGFQVNDVLSGTASCKLKKYNGSAELINLTATTDGLTVTANGTVSEQNIGIASLTGVNTGALLHYDNLTYNGTALVDGDNNAITPYSTLYSYSFESGKSYNVTGIYLQYNTTKEILPRSADDIEEVTTTEPSITVTPNTLNVNADAYAIINNTFNISYENIEVENYQSFSIQFYDANNEETDQPAWIVVGVAGSNEEGYQVSGYIGANDGEARSTYFKVYALDTDANLVYSNLVTITQAEYVAPSYAELPFEFTGGKADIETTDGLSQEGLGSDYSSAPKLKFDSTGDWLLLQFDERPGTLTFDIKGNSFSDGTFTVQTSEDGATYTDLETYTELGNTQSESFNNLGENVRYIKWIYTEKVNGNVALGNIALAEYVEPVAAITLDEYEISAPAEGTNGSMTVTLENMTITDVDNQFSIDFFHSDGSDLEPGEEKPYWVHAEFTLENNVYSMNYTVDANTETTERNAYFKVYGLDDDGTTEAYSELVTVTQAGYVAPTANITLDEYEISAPAEGTYGSMTVTLENMTISDVDNQFSIDFFHSDGSDLEPGEEKPDWVHAEFTLENNAYTMNYIVDGNQLTTERYAYFKVYGLDDDGTTDAYSELVTVTQDGYVVDYAELPFEWEGGTRSAFEALNGTSTSGVGDYGDNQGVYRMKLDGTGDYIQVKTNEQPGIVTIGIKMIGGATTSTLTVQGSANGETFTDVEELTISGSQNDELTIETTNDFAADDRYVRLYFTKGSNVGVGPITIAQVDNTPSITLSSYEIEATAEETDGEITVTYKNIETDLGVEIHWFETATSTDPISAAPEWIDADINSDMNVEYLIEANTGDDRTAYFRVYGIDADANAVYSNLVTVTQDAYIPTPPTTVTYSLVTSVDQIVSGKHYIIASSAENGAAYAMGNQNGNNRKGYAVTIANGQIAEAEGVYEFVINTHLNSNNEVVYTIYDAVTPGYLCAASSSSNYLKTNTTLNDNGKWTISITDNAATITAQGSYSRKLMRYNPNNNNPIFACYATNATTGNAPYLYVKDNDNDLEYYGTEITYPGTSIPDGGSITVGNGSVMTVPAAFTNTDPANLVIEDGGQLIHDNAGVKATVKKNITGYGDGEGNYYFLVSPFIENIDPEGVNNMIATPAENYDLYQWNSNEADEWRNYKQGTFDLIHGNAYLYANKNGVELNITGTLLNSNDVVEKDMVFNDNDFGNWNLVGNPFACNAYVTLSSAETPMAYYRMNPAGTKFEASTDPITPMEGIFVEATDEGQKCTFSRTAPQQSQGKGNLNIQVAQVVNNRDAQPDTDNAIIRFDGGNDLEKFSFSNNSDKLYFALGSKDYAVVNAQAQGEMPVNFKAAENGTYTIDFNMDNVEFNYLHLIDNKTGMDIDLLDTPSYTFEASKIDYASRFRLVFSINGNENDNDNANNDFGFFDANGNFLILGIDGTATLQMMDVTGRTLSSETFSGNHSKAINAKAGVYMLRLIQGNNVRTQKIVVK